MAKYKVVFDREACIGALACIAARPELWKKANDGKVDLVKGKKRKDGKYELLIDESQLKAHKESVNACPVAAIEIEKIN